MKRAAAFLASFLLAALPFGASAADAQADAGSAAESAKGKSIVVYFSASDRGAHRIRPYGNRSRREVHRGGSQLA